MTPQYGHLIFTSLILAVLSGCNLPPLLPNQPLPGDVVLHDRETNLRTEWTGRPYTELVTHYGKPTITMKSPLQSVPPRSIVHYGINNSLLECHDAFVILHGQRYSSRPVVVDYFCR